jgi:dUTP pyrophosphatase
MLFVKLLDPKAKAPTVANPGEDLGYDLYALESNILATGVPVKVRTGIAVEHSHAVLTNDGYVHKKDGLLIRDRSSMAAKGIIVSGGVIDAGYRGEILVLLTATKDRQWVEAGDKIAQMIPIPVNTGEDIMVVKELSTAIRGEKGFGSSGS